MRIMRDNIITSKIFLCLSSLYLSLALLFFFQLFLYTLILASERSAEAGTKFADTTPNCPPLRGRRFAATLRLGCISPGVQLRRARFAR